MRRRAGPSERAKMAHKGVAEFSMSDERSKAQQAAGSPFPNQGDARTIGGEREQFVTSSDAQYQNIVEGSLQGIIIQQDGCIVYANAAMARLFEYPSPNEMIGLSPFEDLIAEDDLGEFRARTEAVSKGEKGKQHPGWGA